MFRKEVFFEFIKSTTSTSSINPKKHLFGNNFPMITRPYFFMINLKKNPKKTQLKPGRKTNRKRKMVRKWRPFPPMTIRISCRFFFFCPVINKKKRRKKTRRRVSATTYRLESWTCHATITKRGYPTRLAASIEFITRLSSEIRR